MDEKRRSGSVQECTGGQSFSAEVLSFAEDNEKKNSVSHTACRWRLGLGYAFGRLAWLHAVGGNSLLRRVLRGTLGLQLFGMKDPVAAETSIGQRLGCIFAAIVRCLCT